MATPFLGSEEYDERAHRLYDEGAYDAALETLKEGLALYPDSVELMVGLGYTRLARDEFVWARHAFENALALDVEHEDALVGLGETLLRFGERARAMSLFRSARERCGGDPELLLSMGRALYREQLFEHALELFREAASRHPAHAEAAAALGYTLHRVGDELRARRQLIRALELDGTHYEARVYLAHLLYDRGDWDAALRELERVPVEEHWDPLAVERVIELKRAVRGRSTESHEVRPWILRLDELDAGFDPLDVLLAELSPPQPGTTPEPTPRPGPHQVRLKDGIVLIGTWLEIVRQIRDRTGGAGDTVAQFMRRRAAEERLRGGDPWPTDSPRDFLRAGAKSGHWRIDY